MIIAYEIARFWLRESFSNKTIGADADRDGGEAISGVQRERCGWRCAATVGDGAGTRVGKLAMGGELFHALGAQVQYWFRGLRIVEVGPTLDQRGAHGGFLFRRRPRDQTRTTRWRTRFATPGGPADRWRPRRRVGARASLLLVECRRARRSRLGNPRWLRTSLSLWARWHYWAAACPWD